MIHDRRITQIKAKQKMIDTPKKLRVCAYVRVSTNNEKQQDSFKNQIEYYTDKINGNPDYINSGIYSDNGVSGNRKDRPGLNQLMEKVRKREVDIILTKSISRLARNTEMFIKIIRELKELGVRMIFEDQKIDTLSAKGELMLSVLGAFAAEERRNVSENIRWAVQKRYQSGKGMVDTNRLLGYDKDENRNLVINETQAVIIRRIFKQFLEGQNANAMATEFNAEGVSTYNSHPWSSHRILSIISNEKYKGDFLMQKTYVDARGKQVINRGERPQYFMENAHPAIVSKAEWLRTQEIRKKRSIKVYPYTGKIICSYCGAHLIRYIPDSGRVLWRCATYMRKGKAICVGARVPESVLDKMIGAKNIDGPLVLVEADHEKRTVARREEDYSLIPASEFTRKI